MSRSRNQDFVRGTSGRQDRVLNMTGLVVIGVICAIVVTAGWIYPRHSTTEGLHIRIEVPFVGPGVATGTAVILRGADVGEVTGLQRNGTGPVELDLMLKSDRVSGITNTFDIDFRPKNYFGSTAVNMVARPGGTGLVAGETLTRMPTGDFTMSTMLEKSSLTVDGTLTSSMISSLDKVIRYTDGLTPLIETGIIVADRVAKTQQALPSELLGRFNDILETLPGFTGQAIETLTYVYNSSFNKRADGTVGVNDSFMDETDQGLTLAAGKLFGQAGALLKSHGTELTPLTQIVAQIAGTLPVVLEGGTTAEDLRTILDRYDSAFTDTGDGRTLKLRIVLDNLPSLATPLEISKLTLSPAGEVPR